MQDSSEYKWSFKISTTARIWYNNIGDKFIDTAKTVVCCLPS